MVGCTNAPVVGTGSPSGMAVAPASTAALIFSFSSSAAPWLDIGGSVVAASNGSPALSPASAALNFSKNSSAISSDDDDPLGGDAALPAVVHPTPQRPLNRLVQVGVGQRDQRVRAAQLHGGLLEVLAGPGRDDRARALAAGQRNAAHPRVVDQHVDLILGGEQVGVRALRGTCFGQQLLEGGRRLRHVGGVLDHDHVAGHQVGRRDPDQLVKREVPRLYPQDHPERGA